MANDENLIIISGAEQLGIVVNADVERKIIEFIEVLSKWRTVYNLTAISSVDEMLVRHVLDSLAIVPFVSCKRILDVGTGAGFPGIPLALVFPEKHFVLLDSNSKKTRFLTYVKAELKILNIEIVHARAENYQPEEKFDCIVTRAVASLADLMRNTRHLYKPGGALLAMKGKLPTEELRAFPEAEVHKLDVPFLDEDRHLVILRP
ncbi:MAG: 16S rRNA (guanine(527)-N(7))-methyltransferase RsmG [Gammaproteobacteria bacterium]|nr:16S rRNA (guanine(527)-N(7))-methyltransferase RsmG [Gammaproteobacteria bacterium]